LGVRVVINKPGSGKTEKLYREIIEASIALPTGETILLIVPEQATLNVQHEMIRAHPNHCITNIEVLSFGRLSYRMVDELGVAGKILLSDVGKTMMIRKIIDTTKVDYPFLSQHIQKKGYVNELRDLMSEFSRYGISEHDFESIVEQTDVEILKLKLRDCGKLYNTYKEQLISSYLSGESLFERLVEIAHESQWLKKATIIIDGFYGFTPIQYGLIEKLMYTAKDLTLTLTGEASVLKGKPIDESHLYYESYYTYHALLQKVDEQRIHDYTEEEWMEDLTHEVNFIWHLRENLYQYPYDAFEADPKGLHLAHASSMKKEVAYLRDSILKLVMDKGYTYNDIGVLAGDQNRYERLINEMLPEAGIPIYFDKKKPFASNNAVIFVMSIIKVFKSNFSYEAIFEYLKSDYVDYNQEVLDHLENYVIRYGIRGLSAWSKEWVYKVPDIHRTKDTPQAMHLLSAINTLREGIILPFVSVHHSKKLRVKDHLVHIYEILVHHEVESKIQNKADDYLSTFHYDEARTYNQVYKVLMTLFDQLALMSTEEKVDDGTFYNLMEAGIEQLELGLVPPRMDQVIIGNLTRSRMTRKKAIFAIGLNEGVVPMLKEGSGLLTDREREWMVEKGVKLAPTTIKNLYREQFYIYMALLNTSERLYLSYTLMNEEGKATRPSHLIHMIKKICPLVKHYNIDQLYKGKIVINRPSVVFKQLLKKLQEDKDINISGDCDIESILSWYRKEPEWETRLEMALRGRKDHLLEDHLSDSHKLYGETLKNSVSRLEQFSKCPFAHFVTYGLKAHEREAYEITMPQLGLIFHKVIERISNRVQMRHLSWSEVTEVMRKDWIEEFVMDLVGEETHRVFFDSNRNIFLLNRLKKILNRSIWAIAYQINQGDFRPQFTEWHFDGADYDVNSLNLELDNQRKMILRGTIDRIDSYSNDTYTYITIIDYKSSGQDLDFGDVYHGLQLQLLVYLNAAIQVQEKVSEKKVIPAGLFYFKIDDPFVASSADYNEAHIEDELLESMQLKGVALNDSDVIKKLDNLFIKASKVIPVSKNKDGQLSKASKVLELEDFDILCGYVRDETQRIGNEIIKGNIEVKPYKKGEKSACDYCKYGGICRFDVKMPNFDYRRTDQEEDKDYLEKMKNHCQQD
jgi:ATP-dependent helicase/nuclease subunit B